MILLLPVWQNCGRALYWTAYLTIEQVMEWMLYKLNMAIPSLMSNQRRLTSPSFRASKQKKEIYSHKE